MLRSNVIKWLLFLNIVAIGVYGVRQLALRRQKNAEIERQMESRAGNEEAAGIMERPDAKRLIALEQSISANGNISDDDLNWSVSLVAQSLEEQTSVSVTRRSNVIAAWDMLRRLTPAQEEKIYQATVPLFYTHISTQDSFDRVAAMAEMARLKDRRAVPHILPLLNDPNKRIRQMAGKVLGRLGYTSSVGNASGK